MKQFSIALYLFCCAISCVAACSSGDNKTTDKDTIIRSGLPSGDPTQNLLPDTNYDATNQDTMQ